LLVPSSTGARPERHVLASERQLAQLSRGVQAIAIRSQAQVAERPRDGSASSGGRLMGGVARATRSSVALPFRAAVPPACCGVRTRPTGGADSGST
jgi:hypothetical protein